MRTSESIKHLALATAALMLSAGAIAGTHQGGGHAEHHPQARAETQAMPGMGAHMNEMRARMQQMRETDDPAEHQKLMEEQMSAMSAMLESGMPCPMMGDGMMQGGAMMMQGGMKMSPMQHPDVLRQRIEAIEKRLDLIQMMMQPGDAAPMHRDGMGR